MEDEFEIIYTTQEFNRIKDQLKDSVMECNNLKKQISNMQNKDSLITQQLNQTKLLEIAHKELQKQNQQFQQKIMAFDQEMTELKKLNNNLKNQKQIDLEEIEKNQQKIIQQKKLAQSLQEQLQQNEKQFQEKNEEFLEKNKQIDQQCQLVLQRNNQLELQIAEQLEINSNLKKQNNILEQQVEINKKLQKNVAEESLIDSELYKQTQNDLNQLIKNKKIMESELNDQIKQINIFNEAKLQQKNLEIQNIQQQIFDLESKLAQYKLQSEDKQVVKQLYKNLQQEQQGILKKIENIQFLYDSELQNTTQLKQEITNLQSEIEQLKAHKGEQSAYFFDLLDPEQQINKNNVQTEISIIKELQNKIQNLEFENKSLENMLQMININELLQHIENKIEKNNKDDFEKIQSLLQDEIQQILKQMLIFSQNKGFDFSYKFSFE